MSDLTEDGFLDGRLRILQPKGGYRAATDPVFLAAAVPAQRGQAVLELGCGVGVASLCLALRTGAIMTGVELQPPYAALARRNAEANGLPLTVIEGDLDQLRLTGSFDHVIANPPYYFGGTAAQDLGRDIALREDLPLARWMDVMARRLRPGGTMTLILGADRLPDALQGLPGSVGSTVVLPLAAREGRAAKRLIIQTKKGGRAAFVLAAPAILHSGAVHDGDGDDASPLARSILREGGGFPQPLSASPRARKNIIQKET
ncbi:tRNA1(Val) (adenine(37)-N6)-methyltransferase [Falsirhodobacter deserti]|uniref:tRNA1(Val) (adenine(37)-N6)-methyltransferase n=1 Tax=Falsirhodobacter deserti TaxID=1365611 RepID=UPI000FE42211|nr:methyltransferase domain-containing protein [Falsirhodobacter deserti]